MYLTIFSPVATGVALVGLATQTKHQARLD